MIKIFILLLHPLPSSGFHTSNIIEGRGGVVVSALDFRYKGRWFEAHSLPSCCLPNIASRHPGGEIPADILFGGNPG